MAYFGDCCIIPRMLPIAARFPFVVCLVVTAMPVGALAEKASPKEAACHAEATKRYIEDFRQVGPIREETHENVVVFVNDKSDYETYYLECLGRWNSIKVR
jgi:hypothetical protein